MANAFFKNTLNIIKNRNGERAIPVTRNLIANVNFDDVDVNSLTWKQGIDNLVAAVDLSKDLSEEEKKVAKEELLKQLGSSKDASLVISALLSAATDNAKELILAKINSGADLASVYLFSIINNIEFNDIADLMISPTVQVISQLNKANIFDENNTSSQVNSVFNKLENGLSMNAYVKSNEGLQTLVLNVLSKLGYDTSNGINSAMKEAYLDPKSKYIEELKEAYTKSNELYADYTIRFSFMRYLNQLEDLRNLKSKVVESDYNTFKKIYEQSQEIKSLGSILGANQGLKTDSAGKFAFLDRIETVVKNAIQSFSTAGEISSGLIIEHKGSWLKTQLGMDDKQVSSYISNIVSEARDLDMINDFNALKFLNDEGYRSVAIKFYNLIKQTVNVLDVITKAPHFREAIDMAATDFGMYNAISAKFTSSYNLSKQLVDKVYQVTNKKDKTHIYSSVNNFLDNVIITRWLDESGTQFTISKGDNYYDKNGELRTAKEDEVISLNTDYGQATFKM